MFHNAVFGLIFVDISLCLFWCLKFKSAIDVTIVGRQSEGSIIREFDNLNPHPNPNPIHKPKPSPKSYPNLNFGLSNPRIIDTHYRCCRERGDIETSISEQYLPGMGGVSCYRQQLGYSCVYWPHELDWAMVGSWLGRTEGCLSRVYYQWPPCWLWLVMCSVPENVCEQLKTRKPINAKVARDSLARQKRILTWNWHSRSF